MNATQKTSLIGSIALALAGMIAGWLAAHNIIPAADVSGDTALIGTGIAGSIGAAIVWYKAHATSDKSMIRAVNANDNGVKVVSENAPAAPVSAPLK